MQVEQEVTFLVNADFGEVSKVISRALIAVHTMKDEHFGISIVEMKNCLSVGLIPSKYSGKAVGSSNIEITYYIFGD